jgi:hypothetical protein
VNAIRGGIDDAYINGILTSSKGIVGLFKSYGVKSNRLCIKIPSTWEGLQACRILQAAGITTLATTLFAIEQAALAGEVGCHYVAPYVNELKVHFDKEWVLHILSALIYKIAFLESIWEPAVQSVPGQSSIFFDLSSGIERIGQQK